MRQSITLFSNKDAKEDILIAPYEEYLEMFTDAYIKLLQITPRVDSVDQLPSETEQAEFIQAFRELMRLRNVLSSFADFDEGDLAMPPQMFEDFKSKHLDLFRQVKESKQKEKVSILNDIDFELELIRRDIINVKYILELLAALKDSPEDEKTQRKQQIMQMIAGEPQLVSKRELIEKFIEKNLPHIEASDDVSEQFEHFWEDERQKALDRIIEDQKLIPERMELVIGNYIIHRA